MAVWTVKGGRHGEREERCLDHGVIGGGWEDIPDLTVAASKDELLNLCEISAPSWSSRTRANYVAQLWSLRERMNDGELVVLPLKTSGTIAVGRIIGPYEYRDDLGSDFRHTRLVEWLAKEVSRDSFDQDLLYSFGAFLTIGRVHRENAEQRVLQAIGAAANVPDSEENGDEAPEAETSIDRRSLRESRSDSTSPRPSQDTISRTW